MAKAPAKTEEVTVTIQRLQSRTMRVRVIGVTELYQNRMSKKAKESLLVGGGRKTAAEKANSVKHNPMEEFQNSVEMTSTGPTALGIKVSAIKGAMANAAIETGGAKKAQSQRLISMRGDLAALYGVPQLKMDVVRSADMNRTPDVRTRAYFPRWCAEVEISFVSPALNASKVIDLLANAGMIIGVGDYRQEKGKGAYGLFRVLGVDEQDEEWDEIVASGGRDAQLAALTRPEYADQDTAELMAFWDSEMARRSADASTILAEGSKSRTKRIRERMAEAEEEVAPVVVKTPRKKTNGHALEV